MKAELYARDISGAQWQRTGEQEGQAVEIADIGDGCVALRSSDDPDVVLLYTAAEWKAFVLGARDGEFDL